MAASQTVLENIEDVQEESQHHEVDDNPIDQLEDIPVNEEGVNPPFNESLLTQSELGGGGTEKKSHESGSRLQQRSLQFNITTELADTKKRTLQKRKDREKARRSCEKKDDT